MYDSPEKDFVTDCEETGGAEAPKYTLYAKSNTFNNIIDCTLLLKVFEA